MSFLSKKFQGAHFSFAALVLFFATALSSHAFGSRSARTPQSRGPILDQLKAQMLGLGRCIEPGDSFVTSLQAVNFSGVRVEVEPRIYWMESRAAYYFENKPSGATEDFIWSNTRNFVLWAAARGLRTSVGSRVSINSNQRLSFVVNAVPRLEGGDYRVGVMVGKIYAHIEGEGSVEMRVEVFIPKKFRPSRSGKCDYRSL